MSETLAEEEKQRIRVELMTEIAKNEQDLEQCNKETGRYGREFLYNIRDLEQLCTITECPLTSHELKEFGIFPKKKSLFNRAWTHVKDIVTKPHKAEEEAARIAREKAEFVERMNRFEEKQEEIAEQFKITKIIQDDQLRSSNEASLERERSNKEEFAERFKIVEEQARRTEEAYVERERIARDEAIKRFKIIEEQVKRSDEARIEMEVSVKELAERHNREEERYNREKAELVERIKIMEEQMRKSEEARIEMERWIEEEKERKMVEEEERRLREKEARIEKERAETEERERQEEENRRIRALRETSVVKAKEELNERRKRKEKERIEKEEEDRNRKGGEERGKKVEERRLRIEADVKTLLALPYELRKQAYRDYFDLEKRRELRINKELAEIELKTEYRYFQLLIETQEDRVRLSSSIWSEGTSKMCYCLIIPISEIESELEIMGKNTQFDCIKYMAKSGDRQIIGMKTLKAKEIHVKSDSNLNDAELRSIVQNKKSVNIAFGSSITVNGLMWIYENMRDSKLDLQCARIHINETERWKFLDNCGNFDRESLTFTGSNHNQEVRHNNANVFIVQDKLKITVSVARKDNSNNIGYIEFGIQF